VELRRARFAVLLARLRRSRDSSITACSSVPGPVRVMGVRLQPGVFEVTVDQALPPVGRLVVELQDEPDVSVLLVRTPDGLHAVTNPCLNVGGGLGSGPLQGCVLVCPSPGRKFALKPERPLEPGLSGSSARTLVTWDAIEGAGRILLAAPPSWRAQDVLGSGHARANS
jgi:nitrite reductase/ring-hydroxylating ferredoxin subunit